MSKASQITREELDIAMQSFEQMGGMAKYAEMLENAMSAMRENFDAIESALRMTQTLHDKQLQGIDHWLSVCKFLIPIFATAAVAGLTIDSQTIPFRSEVATVVGSVGFLIFFSGLFWLADKRQKLINQQENDLAKLNKVFQDGQEIVNILKAQAQDERGEMTDEKMKEQLEKALKIMKTSKKDEA